MPSHSSRLIGEQRMDDANWSIHCFFWSQIILLVFLRNWSFRFANWKGRYKFDRNQEKTGLMVTWLVIELTWIGIDDLGIKNHPDLKNRMQTFKISLWNMRKSY